MKQGLNRLLLSLGFAATALLPASPALAAAGDVTSYETLDTVFPDGVYIYFTGIIEGQSTPTTKQIRIYGGGVEEATMLGRCERLGLLAMSKPGKYRFSLVERNGLQHSCRLSLRAP